MQDFTRATREDKVIKCPIEIKEIREVKSNTKIGDTINIVLDWLFKEEIKKAATVVQKHKHIATLQYITASGKPITTAISWKDLAALRRKKE